MKNTTYEITSDLTASLTDGDHLLTVRSKKHDDYDTYRLENEEWELTYDSLSNRDEDAANAWDRADFVAWAKSMKVLALPHKLS